MKIKIYAFFLIGFISFYSYADNTFRLEQYELENLANDRVFPNRIFYKQPSIGPNSAWFDAIKKGDLNSVKKFVESGQDIEVKDDNELGQTALGWAAFIGYEDIVTYLVEKGADLYATDKADVKHAFKSAIMGGNENVISYLYELSKNNIDINEVEPDGETMLIVSGYAGRLSSIKFLLDNGADISIVSEPRQQNALTYACKGRHNEVINYLIEKGAVNFKTGKQSCD